jgi:hypothetical protein
MASEGVNCHTRIPPSPHRGQFFRFQSQ